MAMDPIAIPEDAQIWVRDVFSECNTSVATKMSRVPTVHETSLDMTLIERLSSHSTPLRLASEWVVRIDAHYLGGGRHFGQWEVADIGILVIFRRGQTIIRTKVGLLQSKRLYPDEQDFEEDEALDYMVGFARLANFDDDDLLKITEPRVFTFTEGSRYRAFTVRSQQFGAIQNYERRYQIPVHYMFYHPLQVPYQQVVPVSNSALLLGSCEVGCRVIPAIDVNATIGKFDKGYSPSYHDICAIPSEATGGGRFPGRKLEDFVVDRLMACHEGYVASGAQDEGLYEIFYRRSGPIAAAVAITFDMPA